jgi:hypothetical protein
MEIYTTFGALVILHSDNGTKFFNNIITELYIMWKYVKIMHRISKNSSSGTVERSNLNLLAI